MEELTKLSELATRQKVKDILLLDIRKIETEISLLREQLLKDEASAKKDSVATPIVQSAAKSYSVKITSYCECTFQSVRLNFECIAHWFTLLFSGWDQTPKLVKVIISLPDVEKLPKENITCNFTNR